MKSPHPSYIYSRVLRAALHVISYLEWYNCECILGGYVLCDGIGITFTNGLNVKDEGGEESTVDDFFLLEGLVLDVVSSLDMLILLLILIGGSNRFGLLVSSFVFDTEVHEDDDDDTSCESSFPNLMGIQ